jgi:hypothetical protein
LTDGNDLLEQLGLDLNFAILGLDENRRFPPPVST